MGGRCDDVCVLDRILEEACGDEAGGVGHIYPEHGSHLVCYFAHACVIPFAGVCGRSADDELGLAFKGLALHFVIVDTAGFRIQAISYGMIENSRGVDGRSVGKVTAHGEVETHEGVAGFEDGHGDCHVGLGAGVRLDVCPAGTIYLFQPVDGQLFNLVYHHAPAIVAFARIPFGIFVRADRTHGLHYLVGNVILGCDEFESALLAGALFPDQVENLKIFFHIILVVNFWCRGKRPLPAEGVGQSALPLN